VLLTITTTHAPATDLGFLLFKHPGKVQSRPVASGVAHVFYPEATDGKCTAALLLEVDPVALVRGTVTQQSAYVNDRPYAASSLLAVALKEVFGTALTGRCDARPGLAATAIPLTIEVPALCSPDPGLPRRLFGPLGWEAAAVPVPLGPPEWGASYHPGGRPPGPPEDMPDGGASIPGMSRYVNLRLDGTLRLQDALNHLYVLLPVLDDAKHYWVTSDEIDKLVRAGEGWLATHPDKALIARRYLAHRRELTVPALARLAEADDTAPEELDNAVPDDNTLPDEHAEEAGESTLAPLAIQRQEAVLDVLRAIGARSVGDFGCGDGALTRRLLAEKAIDRVVAADVSARALAIAERRLRLDRLPEAKRSRITLIQTALTYRDDRLKDLDAAVLMEVIEHVDAGRLPALERSVFKEAAPRTVIVTTPNREHNAVYGMPPGAPRHHDHRWEWDRGQFRDWATGTAAAYGYTVRVGGIGPDDPDAGPPTQMGVFSR
jgi:SAM-dependent methyltransferase